MAAWRCACRLSGAGIGVMRIKARRPGYVATGVDLPTMTAANWLKQHHEELLVETVVVIAGVTFVVIVAGSGGSALVLAPAVLLVGTDDPSEPQLAAVKP
jgi:hypothetical protein